MPTVNVDKEDLYATLGKEYTTEEFRELCFEFGIELEEDTSEAEIAERMGATKVEGLSTRPLLKIDIPANRYDLLCQEGIARSLLLFLEKMKLPEYKVLKPVASHVLIVKPETAKIRPYIVAAILRNITFTQASYDSFIDLQDKLHSGICRKRTLASIGTHDLDTIEGPFTYEALAPKDIRFIPLKRTNEMDGNEVMTHFESDKKISKFLPIIRESPVYPVVYDSKRRVCSLPPIINGEHSKIKLTTKNVFIECTATDLNKARIAVNTLVAVFSQYCNPAYEVEPVEVKYENSAQSSNYLTPDLAPRRMTASVDYINACTGLSLPPADIAHLLNRMSLDASVSPADADKVIINVPVTRSDVLHQCDVMEDVAIAYGYDRLTKRMPSVITVGAPLPINKLSDQMRRELALAGWSEVMPLILCSHDENYKFLNRPDDGLAVRLANPKTIEYQVVRTSLLPGLLKTVSWNQKNPLPIRVFEVSDIGLKDDTMERRSRNERHVVASYSGRASGFENIHGLLNRALEMLGVKFQPNESIKRANTYFIREFDSPTYFPGRAATIHYRRLSATGQAEELQIGQFGVLHPTVLEAFEIKFPTTVMEFNLEPFL